MHNSIDVQALGADWFPWVYLGFVEQPSKTGVIKMAVFLTVMAIVESLQLTNKSRKTMLKSIFLTTVLFSTFSASALEPVARSRVTLDCYKTEELFAALEKDYREMPNYRAKSDDGVLMIVLVSKSGSYTIVKATDKLACIIDGGEQFKTIGTM